MNFIDNILMLGGEILGIPVILILIVAFLILVHNKQDQKQKSSHEKVMELKDKGHDAKICPKCKGKGGTLDNWTCCPECDGLGYILKLREPEEGPLNAGNKVELRKCANCGVMIGKLEKTYVFEGQTVCGQCHQRLKIQD
ncbi:MAG: hypothetical protein ISS70_05115 [Phycisphaerae bacterium]|nr:hypothetical protein [Phycisphaerae bacterium]